MKNVNYFKAKVLFKITEVEKVVDNDSQTSLKITDQIYLQLSGKELRQSLAARKIPVEVVTSAPKEFRLGVLYVSITGDRAWIFKEN